MNQIVGGRIGRGDTHLAGGSQNIDYWGWFAGGAESYVIEPAWEHLKAILQMDGSASTERSTAFKTTQAGSITTLLSYMRSCKIFRKRLCTLTISTSGLRMKVWQGRGLHSSAPRAAHGNG